MRDILISFLPFLLIIGLLYFLFVRQLKNAGRGAMSFGKSKAKMLTREKDSITFKDVAGCDEAKEEVSEVVDFLKDPKKFQRIGGRIPKGVLMVGPPARVKPYLPRRWPARRMFRSSRFQVQISSKCSSVSAPPGCAICLSKAAKVHRASCLSTK